MLCSHRFVKKNYKWNIPDFRTWYPGKGYTGLSVTHCTSKTISVIFFIHILHQRNTFQQVFFTIVVQTVFHTAVSSDLAAANGLQTMCLKQ